MLKPPPSGRRFIFFTKTHWDEPPRLRHQFADLVAGAGNDVVFFEKPTSTGGALRPPQQRTERIQTRQHRELMHHKLRLNAALQHANAAVTVPSIASHFRDAPITERDFVVSFNYDYWFLRRLFPRNPLVTVINDDFICVALFGYTRPLLWALGRTSAASDRVLTVSHPLQRQLAPYTKPELFLPWADRPYRAPTIGTTRDTLLFWGFTNRRIHFPAVRRLAERLAADRPNLRILFVGPVIESSQRDVDGLLECPNIQFLPSHRLDELPLDCVLAAYIPYRPHDLEIDAITISNKTFQLLARGLPILISPLPGMPAFIEEDFVFRVDEADPGAQMDLIGRRFAELQPRIAQYVNGNGADARLAQLLGGA